MADYALTSIGVYPWRCKQCEARFHARLMPINDALHAHCPLCGNSQLKRISADYIATPLSFFWRTLRIPAYRCEPCRHKYFSILPYRSRPRPLEELSSAD